MKSSSFFPLRLDFYGIRNVPLYIIIPYLDMSMYIMWMLWELGGKGLVISFGILILKSKTFLFLWRTQWVYGSTHEAGSFHSPFSWPCSLGLLLLLTNCVEIDFSPSPQLLTSESIRKNLKMVSIYVSQKICKIWCSKMHILKCAIFFSFFSDNAINNLLIWYHLEIHSAPGPPFKIIEMKCVAMVRAH